jgi:hypothetical protein
MRKRGNKFDHYSSSSFQWFRVCSAPTSGTRARDRTDRTDEVSVGGWSKWSNRCVELEQLVPH